ncbi:MAG: cysteine--tRNA ligase [Pseudomonadota bacterium]
MKLYNSLSQSKESFHPVHPGRVSMYVCGVTVYDYCHLGHGRVYTVFDVVARYLRARGYDVTYVRNITDVDDKIIQRAQEQQIAIDELTAQYIRAMHEDLERLGNERPDFEPRATESIESMHRLIEALMERKVAYQSAQGDVLFSVKQFQPYGELSHRNLDELRAGSRVAVDTQKEHPFDFALWKHVAEDEPHYHSPWGPGRPGWHIECSAMAMDQLGPTIDIHGGGHDLIFPHHENERAQCEAVTEQVFVRHWMHVGFVNINQEKMSKSLNNFHTLRSLYECYAPEVLRYFLLSSHYRSPVSFSFEALDQAKDALTRLYRALSLFDLPESKVGVRYAPETAVSPFHARFIEAMDEDFNTPVAMGVLFDLAHDIQRLHGQPDTRHEAAVHAHWLKELGALLGLLQNPPAKLLQGEEPLSEEFKALIEARESARKGRDWAKADLLRKELLEAGISIEDTPEGTVWRRLS